MGNNSSKTGSVNANIHFSAEEVRNFTVAFSADNLDRVEIINFNIPEKLWKRIPAKERADHIDSLIMKLLSTLSIGDAGQLINIKYTYRHNGLDTATATVTLGE